MNRRKMQRFAWIAAGAGLVALAALGLWLRPHAAPAGDPVSGKLDYDQHCASCHGLNLEGQPNWQKRLPNGRLPAPPHDASGHTWHHSDAELFTMVKDGLSALVPGYESDMPAFAGTLDDRQIRDVLAYIKSRWPPAIAARQKQISASAGRDQ
jgi:mono/diheme cytochrome c family protein